MSQETPQSGCTVYGYSRRVVDNDSGLLELKEMTFPHNPELLEAVAEFLLASAKEIRAKTPRVEFHIFDHVPDWRAKYGDLAIVICREE